MRCDLKLIYNLILLKVVIALEVGDECSPNENISKGICKVVTDCKIALGLIEKYKRHPYSRCAFSGIMEVICCPTIITKERPQSLRIADRECQNIIDSTIPPMNMYIVNGETAALGEFPHMVALGYESIHGVSFKCGGSLISNTFVLTAAHCVKGVVTKSREIIIEPPSFVRMGVIDISQNGTDIKIKNIITHPYYTKTGKYNDLALLRLEDAVEFSANLQAVCLYTDKNDPTVPLEVTGWGTINETHVAETTTLRKARVIMIPWDICHQYYKSLHRQLDSNKRGQICAGDPQGLRDTCQGDSGGPLLALSPDDGHYRLVGVTSFGRGCATSVPAVYTRIVRYLNWIERIVWPNSTQSTESTLSN